MPASRTTTRPRGRSMTVDALLAAAWERGATDLLLTSGAAPLARVNGELVACDDEVLTGDAITQLVTAAVGADALARLAETGQWDFSFSWADRARVRGNAYLQRQVPALSLRIIPFDIPSLEELGVPVAAAHLVDRPAGLVLVTGPTGSGKSTTLASMVDRVNTTRACHIVTIEDPIEYLHSHKRSAVDQREVGLDTPSFDSALRSVLREDPDVVLIGEMRDLESIAAAITIAETGHLVLATLHTNDAAQAIDRIVDVFPADRRPQIQVQLSHVLAGVVYQRLVPRVDGGMVAAFEVMVGTHAVRNLVREGKTTQLRNVISTQSKEGMQTLERHLVELVRAGTVSLEAAQSVSVYPRDIDVTVPPLVSLPSA